MDRDESDERPWFTGAGPVRFGDDVPGVYLRGETAAGHRANLRAVIDALNEGRLPDPAAVGLLCCLLGDLSTRPGGLTPEVRRLRPLAECDAAPEGGDRG